MANIMKKTKMMIGIPVCKNDKSSTFFEKNSKTINTGKMVITNKAMIRSFFSLCLICIPGYENLINNMEEKTDTARKILIHHSIGTANEKSDFAINRNNRIPEMTDQEIFMNGFTLSCLSAKTFKGVINPSPIILT